MSIESVMLFNHLILCGLPSPFAFSLSQHQWVLMRWLFPSGDQSIGASVTASVLPMNIQDWFPLKLTGLISLLSKGLSRVFSSIAIPKHQFSSTQPSLWSNFHIHTWFLEKPELWLYGPSSAKWCLCFLIHYLGKSGNRDRFYFLGIQNHCGQWLQQYEIKRHLLLGRKAMTNLDSVFEYLVLYKRIQLLFWIF